ncbi:tetratricopeptide repeat protein [bacterium BMS3Abin09]|nr:tetratricopeptide repeat protein [bacterium BMS3Abin09]GBE41388.1 tetratricopeptide repeat protein [bacterium BMS3Bbin09]HDH34053.1 hypothetical protein [Nitrospirota bacterium]
MKIIILVAMILSLMLPSLCLAQDSAFKDAYSLYYKGKKQEAIKLMEEYAESNPGPEVFYFLGYAYYELKQMDRASRYFNDAFSRKPFYSPIPDAKEEAEKKDLELIEDRP